MNDQVQVAAYDDIESDDSWVAYLRRRLPYSFKSSREVGGRIVQSGPTWSTSESWAENHNIWRRGGAFYAAGRAIEPNLSHLFSLLDWEHIKAEEARVLHQLGSTGKSSFSGLLPVNVGKLEALLLPLGQNHIDRERVAVTNVCQGVELCLKANEGARGVQGARSIFLRAGARPQETLRFSAPRSQAGCRTRIRGVRGGGSFNVG